MSKSVITAVLCLFAAHCWAANDIDLEFGAIQMGMICTGEGCQPDGIQKSVVRVAVTSKTSNSYGSGTLIRYQGRAYLLTCAHLFESDSDYATVQFLNQTGLPVQPLAIDREYDLALLDMTIPGALPRGVTPAELTGSVPVPGTRVFAAGYGSNGAFKVTSATVRGYVRIQGAGARDTLQGLYDRRGNTVRFGDSGGGVFNESGELVATLWGSDNSCLYGTQIGRILVFLQTSVGSRALPVLPPPTAPKPEKETPPSEPDTEENDAPEMEPDVPFNNETMTTQSVLFVVLYWINALLPWGIAVMLLLMLRNRTLLVRN